MCHFSRAPSMRGGRSTRASHKSRPRSLPPPRTEARPNPRRSWPFGRRRTLGVPPPPTASHNPPPPPTQPMAHSSRFDEHGRIRAGQHRPGGLSNARVGPPTLVTVSIRALLRTKSSESPAKEAICSAGGCRPTGDLLRTSRFGPVLRIKSESTCKHHGYHQTGGVTYCGVGGTYCGAGGTYRGWPLSRSSTIGRDVQGLAPGFGTTAPFARDVRRAPVRHGRFNQCSCVPTVRLRRSARGAIADTARRPAVADRAGLSRNARERRAGADRRPRPANRSLEACAEGAQGQKPGGRRGDHDRRQAWTFARGRSRAKAAQLSVQKAQRRLAART